MFVRRLRNLLVDMRYNYMHNIIQKATEAGLTTQEYIDAMNEAHEHFNQIEENQGAIDFAKETYTEGRVRRTYELLKESNSLR